MKKRVRIQIIGNYLDRIRFSLNRAGIYTEDILRAGNPLGFVSLTEANNQNINLFPENIRNNNKKVTQLTIKKNLDEYFVGMCDATGTLWENRDGKGSRDHGFASIAAMMIPLADQLD